MDFFVKLVNSRFDTDKVEAWVTLMTSFYKKHKNAAKVKKPVKKKSKRYAEEEDEESAEEIDLDKPAEPVIKRKLVYSSLPL
jgi:hypothetical protein